MEEALQYLQSQKNECGRSLYSHLATLLLHLLNERPANAAELFEELSLHMKGINKVIDGNPDPNTRRDDELSYSESLAVIQPFLTRALQLCGKETSVSVTDVHEVAAILRDAGYSFARDEAERLQRALTSLAEQEKGSGAKSVEFFGKIQHRMGNYYVAQVDYGEYRPRPPSEIEEEQARLARQPKEPELIKPVEIVMPELPPLPEPEPEPESEYEGEGSGEKEEEEEQFDSVPESDEGSEYEEETGLQPAVQSDEEEEEEKPEEEPAQEPEPESEPEDTTPLNPDDPNDRGYCPPGPKAKPLDRWKNPSSSIDTRRKGLNRFVFFVCTDLDGSWQRLPDLAPEHIVAARFLRHSLTGNLMAPVAARPVTLPAPGNEAVYLRAQIQRIMTASKCAPQGMFTVEPDTEAPDYNEEVTPSVLSVPRRVPDDEFEPNETLGTEESSLADWVHLCPPLLANGDVVDPAAEEEEPEQSEEEDEEESQLELYPEDIDEDENPEEFQLMTKAREARTQAKAIASWRSPPRSWQIVTDSWAEENGGDGAVPGMLSTLDADRAATWHFPAWIVRRSMAPHPIVQLRSVRWPGASNVIYDDGKKYIFYYSGNALDFSPNAFAPLSPSLVQQPNQCPSEWIEPTVAQENEAKHRRKDNKQRRIDGDEEEALDD